MILTVEELARLLRILQADYSLTQSELAKNSNVDQGFISRLSRGKVKRVTRRVQRVSDNVIMQINRTSIPPVLERAVAAYLRSGGDADLLCRQIELLQFPASRAK